MCFKVFDTLIIVMFNCLSLIMSPYDHLIAMTGRLEMVYIFFRPFALLPVQNLCLVSEFNKVIK